MGQVYEKQTGSGRVVWAPLSEDILTCLENPLRQGLYYLRRNTDLGELVLQHSREQLLPHGNWVPFASNLGFSMDYSCTSRVASPDRKEQFIIIQLSGG